MDELGLGVDDITGHTGELRLLDWGWDRPEEQAEAVEHEMVERFVSTFAEFDELTTCHCLCGGRCMN